MGNGNKNNEATRQSAWGKDGNGGEMALQKAVAGAVQ